MVSGVLLFRVKYSNSVKKCIYNYGTAVIIGAKGVICNEQTGTFIFY